MAQLLHLEGKLERINPDTPWGFRLQGGKDFGCPLTISKVTPNSLADKCGLSMGDIIIKIGSLSVEQLKHSDAQDSIKASGNKLDLLLQRGQGYPKYQGVESPVVSAASQPHPVSYYSPNSNYNAAPKPFGGSGPKSPVTQKTYNPVSKSPGGWGDNPDNIRNMSNLNISQPAPNKPYTKFDMLDDRAARAAGHSPVHFDPKPKTSPTSTVGQYNNPSGLYSPSTRNQNSISPQPQEKSGDQPKVYQKSETYRLLHGDTNGYDNSQRKKSTTLERIQQRLDNPNDGITPVQARPTQQQQQQPSKWDPSPRSPQPGPPPTGGPSPYGGPAPYGGAAPYSGYAPPGGQATSGGRAPPGVYAPPAKPFQPSSARPKWAPPKPSGVGTQRGRQGDALMRDAVVGDGRIPMCSSCNIAIRGPFVVAMGMSWCPDHFVCANPQCGTKLLDIGFVEEGGALYCERDYERYFAPHCAKCQAAIIGTCVNALQKTWHPECFICTKCDNPISGGSFHVEDGKPYCDADWAQMFQTMCTSCEFPIEPGDKWVEAMSKNWHAECFNCSMCQVNLEGQPFLPKDGKPYCKKHASSR